MAAHNLDEEPVEVTLRLEDAAPGTGVVDLLGDGATALEEGGALRLRLDRYGYRWLRVGQPGEGALA